MKSFYRVRIEDVYDLMRKINFLEVLDPDIFKLVEQREILADYYSDLDRNMSKNNIEINTMLMIKHLPRYLIFEGDGDDEIVMELFSKKVVCLSKELLNQCRITPSSGKSLGEYLNEYSPEELKNIYDSFPKVFQDKNKADVISFSDFKSRR